LHRILHDTESVSNRARANKCVQPTGWIGAILSCRCSKTVFLIYRCRSFQPAADAQAVGRGQSAWSPPEHLSPVIQRWTHLRRHRV
jgi:hypothetical protein